MDKYAFGKPTVYYVFNQLTKSCTLVLSTAGLAYSGMASRSDIPPRNRLKVLYAPKFAIECPKSEDYTPNVGTPSVGFDRYLNEIRDFHKEAGDERHVALLEVIPGGLCRDAAH